MELSTTGHPGRTPYTPSIPMRREPSDLGLACQTIMGEPDVEQPGFIVSGLCSSGQSSPENPTINVERIFGDDVASSLALDLENTLGSPDTDHSLWLETTSAPQLGGHQYAGESDQLSLEPKDSPPCFESSAGTCNEYTSIETAPSALEIFCSDGIQSFFGSLGTPTTSSQCSSSSILSGPESSKYTVEPLVVEQQAPSLQSLPVSCHERCAYSFDEVGEYPTQHIEISNRSSTFSAWLEQIPFIYDRLGTDAPYEISRKTADNATAPMRLTHQQLLVSQPTNMHEYQFQQNDRACTQSKAVESDPYQPLTLVAAHPRKKRSTRLPEVPLRQSHPFRSSQDHLDLGFDVSTCSKTAQQEQYSGSMYDENGDAMEESDSIRSHRCVQDRFLVMSKLSGMSYKEIKSKGHFREAESTLRGRFRTLTKPKEHRVRKPCWHDQDLVLLRKAVMEHKSSLRSEVKLDGGLGPSKIPWKKVAECVSRNGTYHFGNATCRKKWDEISSAST